MSGLGAVICSWEDEGAVTVSDLTLSNSWATKTMILWIFRARRKKRSFGKKQSSDLDHSFNGLWKPRVLLMVFSYNHDSFFLKDPTILFQLRQGESRVSSGAD